MTEIKVQKEVEVNVSAWRVRSSQNNEQKQIESGGLVATNKIRRFDKSE